MGFIRKAALVIITPLLTASLLGIAVDFGLLRVAGQPDNVKKLISGSGIYNDIVRSALDQAAKSGGSDGALFSSPVVANAANKAFSPQFLQTSTNQAIDGIYRWLEGKTPTPDFKIDLTGAKTNFADYVGQAAEAGAAHLPRCDITALSSLSTSLSDPLNADCLPPYITPAEVGTQARSQILSAQGFMDNPTITASELKGSTPNQTIFTDQLKQLPVSYRLAKQTPYILITLSILLSAAIVFLYADRLKGLRHLGIIVLLVSLTLLALAAGLSTLSHRAIQPAISTNNSLIQADVQRLVNELVRSAEHTLEIFGVVYGLGGLAAIIAPSFIRRRAEKQPDLPGAGRKEKTPAKPATKE